jgi:hypothetical protein
MGTFMDTNNYMNISLKVAYKKINYENKKSSLKIMDK